MKVTGKDPVRHDGKYATLINMGLAGKECTLRGIWRVCIKDFSTFAPLKPHILLGLQWYRDELMIHDISSQNMIVNIQSRYHNIMFQLNVCYINKILKSLSLIFLPKLCILALAGQFLMKPNERPSCLSIYCNMFIDIHITSLFDLQVLLRTLFQRPQIQLW